MDYLSKGVSNSMKRNKIINESITLGESIRITSTGSRESTIWFHLIQIFLIWLGGYAPMQCFISSFQLVNNENKIMVYSILLAACFWGIFFLKRYLKFTIPLTIFGGLYYVWLYINVMEQGFYHIENAVIQKVNIYYDKALPNFVAKLNKENCTTTILLMLLFALFFILAIVIMRGILKEVYMIASLTLVLSGFVVGRVPHMVPLLSYVVYLFMLYAMSNTPSGKRKIIGNKTDTFHKLEYKQYIKLKVAVYLGFILTVLVLFINLVFTKGTYDSKVNLKETKHQIQTSLREFSLQDTMKQIKDRWNNTSISSFFNQLFGEDQLVSGGLDGGKIVNAKGIQFSNETALKLTLPNTAGPFYLKGFAGAVYTGDAWNTLEESDASVYKDILKKYGGGDLNGENLSNKFLQMLLDRRIDISSTTVDSIWSSSDITIQELNVDINYVNASEEFLYLPYFRSADNPIKVSTNADLYAGSETKGTDYSAEYYSLGSNQSLYDALFKVVNLSVNIQYSQSEDYKKFVTFEEEYREFVYDAYLTLPKEKKKSLRNIDLGIEKATDNITMLNVVDVVTKYLAENERYSLTPGKVPEGEDFIDYFLFESHKGYCAHFASAAVMLLRYYGVPARYVEGYIVTQNDLTNGIEGNESKIINYDSEFNKTEMTTLSKTIEIHDTNAHAWVEIYLDGVGWLPIEVTGGYYENGIGTLNDEIEKEVEEIPSPTPLPTNTPKPTMGLSIPTELAQNISPSGGLEDDSLTEDQVTDETTFVNQQKKAKEFDWVIFLKWISIFFIIALVLFYGRYFILSFQRKRRILKHKKLLSITVKTGKGEYLNKSAIYCYLLMERILSVKKYRKKETETYVAFWNRTAKRYYDLPKGYRNVLDVVMKAKFSMDIIEKEEYLEVLNYYKSLRKNLYSDMEGFRRFWLKYWKVV